MRDKTHMESIERWANFIKNNPHKWRAIHSKFINAQILNNRRVISVLLKEKDGREKIKKLYDIENDGFFG